MNKMILVVENSDELIIDSVVLVHDLFAGKKEITWDLGQRATISCGDNNGYGFSYWNIFLFDSPIPSLGPKCRFWRPSE